MRRTRGGTARILAGALALAVFSAGCRAERAPQGAGEGDTTSGPGGAPERGGVAVLAEPADMEAPVPLAARSPLDRELAGMMYMGLTRAAWRDGEVHWQTSNDTPMAAAYHWEYTGPDSTAIRFRMRGGLRWSDGRPLTAADVVFTYRMLRDTSVSPDVRGEVAEVDSVTAENDSTVVIHYRRRSAEMLAASAAAIVPRHIWEGTSPGALRGRRAGTDLVVSGPFRVAAWARGDSIVLAPNPGFSPKPFLDGIVIRIVPDAARWIAGLREGTVDMVRGVAFAQVPDLRAGDPRRVRIEREQGRMREVIAWLPSAHPAFADPAVRRALGTALDVPAILRLLGIEEWATPSSGPYPSILEGFGDDPRITPLPFDTDEADSLLDTRGWRDGDGDGIRDKGGRALSFVLTIDAGDPSAADLARLLERQWRAIGVAAETRRLDADAFATALARHDFQAALVAREARLTPDLAAEWAPKSPMNLVRYADAETARLMEQARAQPTPERAAPFWRSAAERIVQEQPLTWLYDYDSITAVADRLRGVRTDPFGAYRNAWEWWIPRSRQSRAASAASETTRGGR